jgi:transmembrane sensor
MTEDTTITREDAAAQEAAEWFVRLQGDDATGDDWLAFEAWLQTARNAAAYDRLEELWLALEDDAPAIKRALDAPAYANPRRPTSARRPDRRVTRRTWLAVGGALAATVAVGVFGVANWPAPADPGQTYRTAAGEVRDILLADGTRIKLNGASSLTVRLDRDVRRVEMADAEATFDVAHDPKRPFLILVGDRQVRVVGTQFNLRRHAGATCLTVRRGVVEVRPAASPAAVPARVTVGQQLTHRDGDPHVTISAVEPDNAFAWTQGQLVYHQAPLSEVAADLSRRLPHPVRTADAATAQLPFTGVLVVDNEAAVLRRLEAFAPVTAQTARGEVVLRLRTRGG